MARLTKAQREFLEATVWKSPFNGFSELPDMELAFALEDMGLVTVRALPDCKFDISQTEAARSQLKETPHE